MTTRGRPSRSPFNCPGTDKPADGDAIALDRTLRALYAAYEALRDTPAPPVPASAQINRPLTELLRAPNWWRAAQQQLAGARAALSEATLPAAGSSNREATLPTLARALSAGLMAAVLLRLPYDAWRPDVALLGGQQPADAAQAALASPASECAALLAEIGVRCRLTRRSPSSLAAICQEALTV